MMSRGERTRPHPHPPERVIDSLQRRVVAILRQLLASAQDVSSWHGRHRRHQSHPTLQTPLKPGAHGTPDFLSYLLCVFYFLALFPLSIQ
jgi:hypothetical protein